MKKIYLIVFIVFVTLQLKAQFFRDEWGDVIPFSLTEKYKDHVNTNEIHSLVLDSFKNDSLFFKHNNIKSYKEAGNTYVYGFGVDSSIVFRDYAKKIEIEEGTLWIMTIESKTAQSIGIKIANFDLPENVYFTIYSGTIPYLIQDPEVGFKENITDEIKHNGFEYTVHDSKAIIEFFVPKGLQDEPSLIINKIIYGFKGLGKPGEIIDYKKYKEENSKDSSSLLKSGGHTDSPALSCQKDVACQEVSSWAFGSKSVVYIVIPFNYNGSYYESRGTGFFVNKSGSGYSGNDNPILITCGHLYNPEISPSNYIDISNNHNKISVFVDYQNESCNETKVRYGKNIIGIFSSIDRVMLGESYIHSAPTNESKDYAILRPTKTIDKLAKYKIEYAGWTANPDYTQVGYAAIGHPQGDVKKINVENGYAPLSSNYFSLYFDKGVSEHGFSGSPIFNTSKKVVGWLCTGSGDCASVGNENSSNHTTCGRFDDLHFYLTPYIDPTNSGLASSSNPSPPLPSELPPHCRNCVQDVDETGIDCGGSCYPCGMQDVINLKTLKDIPGPVKSRYDLIADPDPNTTLVLKSGNYSFEAGMNIFLNGGFEVAKGAVFYASIDNELMSEADRGCGNYCINAPNIKITPDGDGISDYWAFSQSFVTKYGIRIFDRNNNTYYSKTNQPIYENGWVIAWDGSGAIPTVNTYYGTLTLYDCNGNIHTEEFYLYVTILKSAEINEDISITNNIPSLESSIPKIKVYPNPFTNKVSFEYSGNEFPVKYKLTDMNGKLIIEGETDCKTEIVNLNGFANGAYIINVKAGECNLVQKLIKE